MKPAPITLTYGETRRRMAEDRRVLAQCLQDRGAELGWPWGSPSYVCVALYRLARYCFVRGWTLRARCLWQINLFLTGADISPLSDLGEGLLVVHPVAVTIVGRAGRGLIVEGFGGMGGGMAMDDIGAGPGLPVLGQDVELARGAMVLGPVAVGDRVRVGPGCTVTRDIPDDTEVEEQPLRLRRDTLAESSA